MRLLVTGGAGFIGTNFVRYMLRKYSDYEVVNFDKLTYAGNLENLKELDFFRESTPLAPSSPYSASKAAADLLVQAHYFTYKLPVITTRCSNNYGPFQFPEKLLPLLISNAMNNLPLPIYGDGHYIRDWIYVEDHCRAIDLVLHQGKPGQTYNIGGCNERQNLEVARLVLTILHKPESLITFVKDRPGHDRRYAID